ncbi:MAG: hypothetical protein HQK83_18520 [Fibrobacteria bacterium]|nr:hypothetical protein [Fibrobacteria bacterium]
MKLKLFLILPLLIQLSFSQVPLWEEIPEHVATTPVVFQSSVVNTHSQTIRNANRVDILFFGNSITEQWTMGGKQGLATWNQYYADKYAVNIGIGGDRTQNMIYRILNGNIDFKAGVAPKVIVAMIGTNNIGWGEDPHTVEQTVDGIRAVLQLFRRRLPTSRILLLGIFKRIHLAGETEIMPELDQINNIIKYYADGDAIRFLDFGDKFVKSDGTIDYTLLYDALHPSAAGYQLWAEEMDSLLTAMLAAPPLEPLRIMPLGNSITEGYGSTNSWRRYLDGSLRNRGVMFDFVGSMSRHANNTQAPSTWDYDLNHEGHWGKTVDWLLPLLGDYARNTNPDLVLLHMGTNDLRSGNDPIADKVAQTVKELGQAIDTLRQVNPNVKIALAKIIPMNTDDPLSEVQALNVAIGALAAEKTTGQSPIVLVDQYTNFIIKDDLVDQFHTNDPGAVKMAGKWLEGIDSLIPMHGCTDSRYKEYNPRATVAVNVMCISACKDSIYNEYAPDAQKHDQAQCKTTDITPQQFSVSREFKIQDSRLILPGQFGKTATVQIRDLQNNLKFKGSGKKSYNLAPLPPGLYSIELISQKIRVSRLIILNK